MKACVLCQGNKSSSNVQVESDYDFVGTFKLWMCPEHAWRLSKVRDQRVVKIRELLFGIYEESGKNRGDFLSGLIAEMNQLIQ